MFWDINYVQTLEVKSVELLSGKKKTCGCGIRPNFQMNFGPGNNNE